MDLDRPAGDSGHCVIRLPRGRDCDAPVELVAAAAVRLAHAHLLASARVVGALPDFVRGLGRLWRWQRAYASSHERTHERTVGKDDTGGTRAIPPRPSWLLGRYATAGFQDEHLIAGRAGPVAHSIKRPSQCCRRNLHMAHFYSNQLRVDVQPHEWKSNYRHA